MSSSLRDLRTLPVHPGELWQGGLIEADVPGPRIGGSAPRRLRVPVWIGLPDALLHVGRSLADDDPGGLDAVTKALCDFAFDQEPAGHLPGCIEVRDAALARRLRAALAGIDIEIVQRRTLEALDKVVDLLTERLREAHEPPGLLEGDRVTIDAVRAFAEAAVAFHDAAPWRELANEDLLRVEAPTPPRGLELISILGEAGIRFGIVCFNSVQHFWTYAGECDLETRKREEAKGIRLLTFETETDLPESDRRLWAEHDLPRADGGLHPVPMIAEDRDLPRRPNITELVFFEGLLRALAASTGEQFDAGRWTVPVQTASGPVEFTLALPDVLDPPDHATRLSRGMFPDRRVTERMFMAARAFTRSRPFESLEALNEAMHEHFADRPFDEIEIEPASPLEAAQLLCYDAFDAVGRRRLLLARQALETSRDCADAWLLLAERIDDPREARPLLEEAVAAGERAVAAARLQWCDDEDEPVPDLDARPACRAHGALAPRLEALGEPDAAIDHYRRAITLDPQDPVGARYRLLTTLLRRRRLAEARALLEEFHEPSAYWHYGRAIAAFLEDGDTPKTRIPLRAASRANPRVLDLLLAASGGAGGEGAPAIVPPTTRDDAGAASLEQEARWCADDLAPIVTTTPGAREWLESLSRPATKNLPKRGVKRRKKRSR